MSLNIPEMIKKDDYNKKYISKLDKNFKDFVYTNIFKNCYKEDNDTKNYVLKDGLSEEKLAKLDYILKRIGIAQFGSLKETAEYFRMLLDEKKFIILFAYNGTGKTRLSMEFKTLGQEVVDEAKTADTLYYNAFTEDLFYWDNDLENDEERLLKLNSDSRFFSGLKAFDMDNKIRPLLHGYADFDFKIDYENLAISFYRETQSFGASRKNDNIKISRGEENIFVWCFFLAIVQLVVDKENLYKWVKYIYVDDPISSLDDNNVIAVATHLAQILKSQKDIKVVISSHHTLFFNVLCNEISNSVQVFLQKNGEDDSYLLKDTTKTPFFHHVALLRELKKASDSG